MELDDANGSSGTGIKVKSSYFKHKNRFDVLYDRGESI